MLLSWPKEWVMKKLLHKSYIFVVGSLVILTDDGSTAGVGFIFLPVILLVPGIIAFVCHCIFSINKNIAS